jgi:hypothetical protein
VEGGLLRRDAFPGGKGMNVIKYREISGYKYQLTEDYCIQTAILCRSIKTKYFEISPTGLLFVFAGYCWDGPSGPTIDTKSFMRGSLVHDALYQLMRLSIVPQCYRKYADELLVKICKEDGMCSIRAWWVLKGVRWFAASCAAPDGEPEIKVLTAP